MSLQNELQHKFELITNLSDFKLRLTRVCHPDKFGEYIVKERLLKLYILDSDGSEYPREVIEREALHELAHHLQFHHAKYVPSIRTLHGAVFRKQFAKVLNKYYNSEVPRSTRTHLLEEGYINASEVD